MVATVGDGPVSATLPKGVDGNGSPPASTGGRHPEGAIEELAGLPGAA